MPETTLVIEAHILDKRTVWCDECWRYSRLEADVALVDHDTLKVFHRFSVRSDCQSCE